MTQEELGAILGIKKAAVQKIESGRNANIRADKLMLLCETFNVFPANLLYGGFPAIWEKVLGIEPEEISSQVEDVRTLARLYALTEARFGPKGISLLDSIESLNEKGIGRAISYVSDLRRIEEYRKGEETR